MSGKAMGGVLGPLVLAGLCLLVVQSGYWPTVIALGVSGLLLLALFIANMVTGGFVMERTTDRHRRRDWRGLLSGVGALLASLLLWRAGEKRVGSMAVELLVLAGILAIFGGPVLQGFLPHKPSSK